MKNTYMKTASGVYINYFLLGMVNIMLASNMPYLTEQWDTDNAGVSYIIAAIGVGKLLTYAFTGYLSDKIGRKPLIIASSLGMGIFLIGIPLSSNYHLAFVFAILAGVANSSMDAGSYPGLTELFPRTAGSASVLVKAFMSAGAFILPFMILFFSNHEMFYGYAFFIPAAIYLLNLMFLFTVSFPSSNMNKEKRVDDRNGSKKFISEPVLRKEGFALVIIGFTSTGLFTVSQIWLPTYGQQAVGMPMASSIKLISYYSLGALISVLVLSVLLKKIVRPITVIMIYPIITFISILTILLVKVPVVVSITAFFIGLSTAGIFQLAITIMTELFWRKKGTVTGIVATAAGLASIVMPLVTGWMSKSGNISIIFIFDALLSVTGFIAAAYVYYRYEKLIGKGKVETGDIRLHA
ncbi:MFS transporter [Bacillus sp. SD075]|uniref:MFS transporter n=1 Tax=Bacillus sp. SD075 TaxID=2781732 RepID=UPI001A95A831|nr:MFS transporter [Bacillus sp. SD075]MBO1000801.1 MFS transporter [Bacillus sp. SD075]